MYDGLKQFYKFLFIEITHSRLNNITKYLDGEQFIFYFTIDKYIVIIHYNCIYLINTIVDY